MTFNFSFFSRIVYENKQQIAQITDKCDEKEILEIRKTESSVKILIGDVNCENFTGGEKIETGCKPVTALTCIYTVLNATSVSEVTSLTCT